MHRTRFAFAVLLALVASPVLAGVDLTKIDRGGLKEPRYQSASPQYCLVVFGPQAETRVWVVRDGGHLYVDCNGNGDLTEAGEKLALTGHENEQSWAAVNECKITAKAGVAAQTTLEFRMREKLLRIYCQAEGTPWQSASSDGSGELGFGEKPTTAPVVHFQGPLSLTPDEPYTLQRGAEPTEFYIFVGTPGLGKGTFACMGYGEVPRDVHPQAEFEFPAAAGKPAIKLSLALNKRC